MNCPSCEAAWTQGAREIVVAADGSGDYAALQEAIDAAAAGGSIRIKPGVYKGSVRLEKPLTIKGVDGSIRARASKDLPVLLLGSDGHLTVTEQAAGARISGVVFTQFAENFENLAKYSEQRDDFDEKSTDERAKAVFAWLKKECPDGFLAHIAGAVEFHDTALLCPMEDLCEISAGEPLFSDCFFGRGLTFRYNGCSYTGVHIENDASPVMLRCSFGGASLYLHDKAGGTYRDCNITACGSSGILIRDMAGGTYENCDIHDNVERGIHIGDSAAPTIENCKIYNNGVMVWPAILVTGSAEPTVRNCEIYGHLGSGIRIHGNAGGTYEDCDIHDNGILGNICVEDSAKPTVRNCEIYRCSGGGICISDEASGIYEDCNIHDNESDGIKVEGEAHPTIKNCKIYDNEDIPGNGIRVEGSAKPTVRNCEIYGHSGEGIFIFGSASGTYEDCNIHDNEGNNVSNISSGNPVIRNC